ncbi:MAG: hypothetical protein ACOY45_14045 [Pseudomonadota bacterium]
MFTVAFDRDANRVVIRVHGFWRSEDVPPFATAVGSVVRQARAVSDDFDVLVESLDFPVQANDVADLLPNVMRAGMSQTAGRAAVVVGSHLNRLQAERTLTHPRVRVFVTAEAAEAWLSRRD